MSVSLNVIGEYSNYLPQEVTLDYSPAGGCRSLAKGRHVPEDILRKEWGGASPCALLPIKVWCILIQCFTAS